MIAAGQIFNVWVWKLRVLYKSTTFQFIKAKFAIPGN